MQDCQRLLQNIACLRKDLEQQVVSGYPGLRVWVLPSQLESVLEAAEQMTVVSLLEPLCREGNKSEFF